MGTAVVDERVTILITAMTSQMHIHATLKQMYTTHMDSLGHANYTSIKLFKDKIDANIYLQVMFLTIMMVHARTHRHTNTQ